MVYSDSVYCMSYGYSDSTHCHHTPTVYTVGVWCIVTVCTVGRMGIVTVYTIGVWCIVTVCTVGRMGIVTLHTATIHLQYTL